METRPNMDEYRRPALLGFIDGLAIIVFLAGVVLICVSPFSKNELWKVYGIIIGALCILNYLFMVIMVYIVSGIHRTAYMTKYYGEETINFHQQALLKIHSIEMMLQQQQGNDPRNETIDTKTTPTTPQMGMLFRTNYTSQQGQNIHPVPGAQHPNDDLDHRRKDQTDETPNKYTAQFRRS